MGRTRRSGRLLPLSIALTVVAGLLLVLASPLALPVLDNGGDRDWGRLSEIGQTYGAVSALLSALALGGVIASLALQRQSAELDRRAARLDREAMLRSTHLELIKLALDDPTLLQVFGEPEPSYEERRLFAYINLWVMYWRANYEVGTRTGEEVDHAADRLFLSPIGRRFWAERGVNFPAETAEGRTFYDILTARWRLAMERESAKQRSADDGSTPDNSDDDAEEE